MAAWSEIDYVSSAADAWFESLATHVYPIVRNISNKQKDEDRVRIAMLDTGVDLQNEFIHSRKDRIKGMKSLYNNDNGGSDLNGHGTNTAGLLLKVAPAANIYVIQAMDGRGTSDWKHIAQGILCALQMNVDIILLPVGTRCSVDDDDRDQVYHAIQHAYQRDILIFAPASNEGANYGISYPAILKEVICIFSTDGDGNRSRFSPPPRKHRYNFATLGEAVQCLSSRYLLRDSRRQYGTSIAAAIAAGIAATILDYARQNLPMAAKDSVVRSLKTSEGMQAAFQLVSEEVNGYHYMIPWKLFNENKPKSFINEALCGILGDNANTFTLFDDEIVRDLLTVSKSTDRWFQWLDERVPQVIDDCLETPKVKIAILDTGIDLKNDFIRVNKTRIKGLESWIDDGNKSGDLFGHGTHTAGLLLRVAPTADIYVARVVANKHLDKPENIANAIRWATEKDVDIITMSFGFPKRDDDQGDEIYNAIQEAYHKSIIMFAAASNNGGNLGIAYPANLPELVRLWNRRGLAIWVKVRHSVSLERHLQRQLQQQLRLLF
ncbi:uncharacterized protein PAC_01091 [Aspergillus udagawae]|uniref:Uncharacterized protein PAC_01091 n=1 Tax=Aspergillus udagawae TaxID=91492 RepID=A0A8H3S092_9EURO|nr:uncharacterized protein PAC_01091 [Aspergillus udagawae]